MTTSQWIINRPQLQPRLQRNAWRLVTVLIWLLYFYLLMPLLTLLMWFLGIRLAIFQLAEGEYGVDPFLLLSLPIMALTCAVLLITWAEYNRRRFGSRPDRRSSPPLISRVESAKALGATPEVLAMLDQGRITVLHMDDDAHPRSASNRPVPALPEDMPEQPDDSLEPRRQLA